MGRTIESAIKALPRERRVRIEARYRSLKFEVESLRALRKVAGKAQTDVASSLRISQPSVSKMEQQDDMYLSTLRNYVRAVGGELELVIRFPKRPPLRIKSLGELQEAVPTRRATRTK